jgi:hypothetical protein
VREGRERRKEERREGEREEIIQERHCSSLKVAKSKS